jgi:xanthine/CO dehydrogenase XdhC/CoxF family maturation factor
MRGGDDVIWGLGLGCEGAMNILLLRAGPENEWQPLTYLARCLADYERASIGVVVESERPDSPPGSVILRGALGRTDIDTVLEEATRTGRTGWFTAAPPAPRWKMFALPLSLPPKLLLLGAGPEAAPVVEFAARLNWRVTLVDHRPAYADATHFPGAERVLHAQPDELFDQVDAGHFAAAVVMSHHLPSDLKYLRALSTTSLAYIGLLGPAVRRERLLADLGEDAQRIRDRLHAPVGLALGGRSPESIALSIIAQIHAFVHGAPAATRHP